MTFDFRDRFGLSVDNIGDSITFGEAVDLVAELRDQPGSRTHASSAGWSWPATIADIATILHAESFINVHRDRKVTREPIRLPRPWSEKPAAAEVTAEERAQLRARLVASSPFAD